MRAFAFFSSLILVTSCQRNDDNIFDAIVLRNIRYFFGADVEFDDINKYLRSHIKSIDHVAIVIKIPTPHEHVAEMVLLSNVNVNLNSGQTQELINSLSTYLARKSARQERTPIRQDAIINIYMKDQSFFHLKLETQSDDLFHSLDKITYAISDRNWNSIRTVSDYRIDDSEGLQLFLASFALAVEDGSEPRGVARIKEVWPGIEPDPRFSVVK